MDLGHFCSRIATFLGFLFIRFRHVVPHLLNVYDNNGLYILKEVLKLENDDVRAAAALLALAVISKRSVTWSLSTSMFFFLLTNNLALLKLTAGSLGSIVSL